jgi:hypothetical protein
MGAGRLQTLTALLGGKQLTQVVQELRGQLTIRTSA